MVVYIFSNLHIPFSTFNMRVVVSMGNFLQLMLFDEQGWPWFHGGLLAAGCVSHSGAGGPSFWVDREQGVVGVYFATCLDMDANTGDLRWDFDLFQNLVTAAVID